MDPNCLTDEESRVQLGLLGLMCCPGCGLGLSLNMLFALTVIKAELDVNEGCWILLFTNVTLLLHFLAFSLILY